MEKSVAKGAKRCVCRGVIDRRGKNKTVAFIENGSWAAMAEKVMRKMLEGCKDIAYAENGVHIKSALSEENLAQIDALADELCK